MIFVYFVEFGIMSRNFDFCPIATRLGTLSHGCYLYLTHNNHTAVAKQQTTHPVAILVQFFADFAHLFNYRRRLPPNHLAHNESTCCVSLQTDSSLLCSMNHSFTPRFFAIYWSRGAARVRKHITITLHHTLLSPWLRYP